MSYHGLNKIPSNIHLCLCHALTSEYEKMIGLRAALTEVLKQSVTTHYRATKWYLSLEFLKNWHI